MLKIVICFILLVNTVLAREKVSNRDKICGKWITKEQNLIIEIYKQGGEFKTKIVWFKNVKNLAKNIEDYYDINNPDPALRNRKILGMDIVFGLLYNPKTNSWEKGRIYDAKHGRFWDSSAIITDDDELEVTGYWKFKWIGKTLTFNRM